MFVGHAVEVLCEHDVFDGVEVGNQMKLLKDETDFLGARAIEFAAGDCGDIHIVEPDFAGGWAIEAANQIDECRLAGAGRAHDRDPFPGSDFQRKIVERANFSRDVSPGRINAADVFELDQRFTAEKAERADKLQT